MTVRFLIAVLAIVACSTLKKDNEPQPSFPFSADASAQRDAYRAMLAGHLDEHGMVVMGSSIGDSGIFSCLARYAGVTKFDVSLIFTADGKPIRHPDIATRRDENGHLYADAPTSHDDLVGHLWCLYDLGKEDKPKALALVEKMIEFGKDHRANLGGILDVPGWLFCTDEDRAVFDIDKRDWVSLCYMSPANVKDIYRVAKWLGADCDITCHLYMELGANLPTDHDGFNRHTAILTTVRNGCIEGGINDLSLDMLRKAAESQQENALFQAAYHLFKDGDQSPAYAALDSPRFPRDRLPTKNDRCGLYIWERDQDHGEAGSDWDACQDEVGSSRGMGVDYAIAATLALEGCR